MTTQVQPKDKTVTVNGLSIHYLDWGAVGRPVMVLLHGLRGHSHSWDDVSAAMCQNYHVLALDQRGRGDSDWAKDGDYSTDAFVSDVDGFCQSLNLESFVLMGHSMGGRNSMAFAALYPDRVQKLIIVDIGPTSEARGLERIQREVQGVPEEFDSFDAVVEYMGKQNTYASDEVLRRRLRYATRELANGKIGWKYDIAIRQQRRQDAPAPPQQDMWPVAQSIPCPTLIVRGTETDLLSPETAKRMVDTMPNAQLAEVQRAGHMVFEDNPEGFLEAIGPFL